ncbi:DUF3572 domain-containing protein [Sphingomonas sp. 1P06PA]|uniref:DUF3572 domain-containing protein n=1 Tax=Sphingomonas sp. 1P06PA TaxID=554121 RepID=UPI0039A5AABF
MHVKDTIAEDDAQTVALAALAWTLSEDARAQRLLALTGLDGDSLRMRATDPALLSALIGFLETHEPDLIACADAIGRTPADLVSAGQRLGGDRAGSDL